MRLLVITNDYPPDAGGIQQYVASLAARFPGEVLVLAPRRDGLHPEAADEASNEASDEASGGARDEARAPADVHVRVTRGRARFLWPTPGVRRWIESAAQAFAPDAVLFAAPFPLASLGPSLRARLRVPFAVLAHGAEVGVPAAVPLLRRFVVGPLRRADVVFTNSRHTTAMVEHLRRRPAHFLGIGVDLETFAPSTRAPSGRPVVGAFGRFVPRKGHAEVIRAVAALRARGREVELLVVGCGRLERRLRRLAASLAVPARFAVDVPWSRLPELHREIDAFALPCRSRWLGREAEGLGIVFLEAAASGLPVVAGDSGGAPETVVPGVTGFVVRGRRELIEALDRLLADPARARAMGARGRERMRQEFSWEEVVKRLVAGLEDARRRFRPPESAASGGDGARRPSAARS